MAYFGPAHWRIMNSVHASKVAPEALLEELTPGQYLRLKGALQQFFQTPEYANGVSLDGMTKEARRCAHTVAGKLGMTHSSNGQGASRTMHVKPKAASAPTTAVPPASTANAVNAALAAVVVPPGSVAKAAGAALAAVAASAVPPASASKSLGLIHTLANESAHYRLLAREAEKAKKVAQQAQTQVECAQKKEREKHSEKRADFLKKTKLQLEALNAEKQKKHAADQELRCTRAALSQQEAQRDGVVRELKVVQKEYIKKDEALVAERREVSRLQVALDEKCSAQVDQSLMFQRAVSDHETIQASMQRSMTEERERLESLVRSYKQKAEECDAQLQRQAREHAEERESVRAQEQVPSAPEVLSVSDEGEAVGAYVEASAFELALEARSHAPAVRKGEGLAALKGPGPRDRRQAIEHFLRAPLPEHAVDKKVEEGTGTGQVKCGHCDGWKTMRNLKLDFFSKHVESCLRKHAKKNTSGQSTTLENFGVVKQPRIVASLVAASLPSPVEVPPPSSLRPRSLECQGVLPLALLPNVLPCLLKSLREFCDRLPGVENPQQYLVSLFSELYVTMEKQASHVDQPGYAHGAAVLEVVGGSKRLRSKWCGKAPELGPPGMNERDHTTKNTVIQRKVGPDSAVWMGCGTWALCGHCAKLGHTMGAVMSRLTTAANAKLSLAIPGAPKEADSFLSKILHCSAAGCPRWCEGPLNELRSAAKLRLDFLNVGSEVGCQLPYNAVREEVAFLKRVRLIVLESPGVLQGKAAFGALNAVLTHMCRKAGVGPSGIRHTLPFRDFILGAHLVKAEAKRYLDQTLLDGKPVARLSLQRWRRALRGPQVPSCMLDLRSEQVEKRAEKIFIEMHPVSELEPEIVTLGLDEVVALKTLIYNKKHNIVVGASASASAIEWTDDTDWSALKDNLANKVKFWSLIPQLPKVHPLSMRPGGANGDDEYEMNDTQVRAARKAGGDRFHVLAAFPDAVGKEQKWVRETLVAYMEAPETARHPKKHGPDRPYFAGVGVFHQLKNLRNSPAFGASMLPWGGRVVSDITLFSVVGASIEDVQVKDFWSDWRVARLERMVHLLPLAQAPPHWTVGTMAYFQCMNFVRLAAASRSVVLDRKTRLRMLWFSLFVLHSWRQHHETRKNTVTCCVAMLLVLKHGAVSRPWRCSDLPLEYFFGTLRTALNSDQLSVNQMLELVEKGKDLETLSDRNNWGRWSTQGAGEKFQTSGLPRSADLSDAEFLSIGSEMATIAHLFLRTMGWRKEDISPLTRPCQTWVSFASLVKEVLRTSAEVAVAGEPARKKRKKGDKADTLSTPEVAGVLHALAEPLVADAAFEQKVEGLVDIDTRPLDGFPEDCAPPNPKDGDVAALTSCIASLGACDNLSELISALEKTSRCAHAFQPVYKHKGKGNRSTLYLRLQAAGCEQAPMDQHSDMYINMDAVVWDQKQKRWGRPISTYSWQYNKWMPDIVAEEKVAGIRRHAFKDKRVALEAVTFSSVLASSGKTLWQLTDLGEHSMWSASGTDVRMLPGTHAVSSIIARRDEGEWRCFASNLKSVLEEATLLEKKGPKLDEVQRGAVEALLDATLSVPARKMLLETTGFGPAVLRYTEIFDAQFEAKASSIKAKWGTQRRDHPELWTSPL